MKADTGRKRDKEEHVKKAVLGDLVFLDLNTFENAGG